MHLIYYRPLNILRWDFNSYLLKLHTVMQQHGTSSTKGMESLLDWDVPLAYGFVKTDMIKCNGTYEVSIKNPKLLAMTKENDKTSMMGHSVRTIRDL